MLPTTRTPHRGRLFPADPFEALRAAFDQVGGVEGESYGAIGRYPVDIREDQDALHIDAELPGFRKEEVDVTLEDGTLTIKAERKAETPEGVHTHLAERRFTRVFRQFALPGAVDEGSIEASLNDGVLHLKLNKREEVKPRKIEVR